MCLNFVSTTPLAGGKIQCYLIVFQIDDPALSPLQGRNREAERGC